LPWFLRDQFQNVINDLDFNDFLQSVQNQTINLTAPTHTDIKRLESGQVGGQVCFSFSLFYH